MVERRNDRRSREHVLLEVKESSWKFVALSEGFNYCSIRVSMHRQSTP